MRNIRQTVDLSSRTEAANNINEGFKITKETSDQAKKKMGSLISLSLRGYVMMRMLNNNFGYSFILDKNVRRPQKGLAYFAIHRIYDNNMELLFNEDDINLSGKEKKRYCQTKTLEIMMNSLEKFGYKFYTISTKKAERENLSSYKNLTNVKIRRFELIVDGVTNKFDMEYLENTLGKDEYYNVLNEFKTNISHVILCNNNCSEKIIKEMNLDVSKVGIVFDKSGNKIEFSYLVNEEQHSNKVSVMNIPNQNNVKSEVQLTEVVNINPSIQMNEDNQTNYVNDMNQMAQINDMNSYNQMNYVNQYNILEWQQMNGMSTVSGMNYINDMNAMNYVSGTNQEVIQNNVNQQDQMQTVMGVQGYEYEGFPQMSSVNCNYEENYEYEQPVNNILFNTTSVVSNETGYGYDYSNVGYNGFFSGMNTSDQTNYDNSMYYGYISEQSIGCNYTQMDLQSNTLRVQSQFDNKTLTQ